MIKKSGIKVLGLMAIFLLTSLSLVLAGDDAPAAPAPTCADNPSYCAAQDVCETNGNHWIGLAETQTGTCEDPANNCCIPKGTVACGDTISSSIALTDDIVCDGQANGIVVGANNIKIDCQGHKIGGSLNPVLNTGISLRDRSNVVIQNCGIIGSSNSKTGFSVYTSSNILLKDVSTYAVERGITFHTTTDSIIDGADVSSCTGTVPIKVALVLERSSGNTIKNSEIRSCNRGLYLNEADNNIIHDNDLDAHTGGFSLYLYNIISAPDSWPEGNIFYNNIIRGDKQLVSGNDYNTTYNCSAGPNIAGGVCIGGNYWEGAYTGLDPDEDGVGNTPFTVLAGVTDHLPLIACSDDCSLTAKQCVTGSGTEAYRTCGDYDGDTCSEWSPPSDCASGELCSLGNCVQDPLAPIPYKVCCGGSGIPYSTAKVCAVPLPGQENNCGSVIQYGTPKTWWVFPKEVKDSEPIIACDPGLINNRKYYLCGSNTVENCEASFSSVYSATIGCEIIGYYISKNAPRPSGTQEYKECTRGTSVFIANPYNPPGTYCTYNNGYKYLVGYVFLTEQSAKDFGAQLVTSCQAATDKTSCLASEDACTWTPPGTTTNPQGGCCDSQEEWSGVVGCGPTQSSLCLDVFDEISTRNKAEGFTRNDNYGPGLDPINDEYCAKIANDLSYGFLYDTQAY